jgi:hypothetical protein
MAKIQKTSPLLNLQNFQVFLNDTVASSNYFRVSELSDTFTAGKNGFLIEGSPFLKGDTEIKIEILDTNGDPLFTQAGEGIPEYYEGLSKLVTAHVYQSTPIGIGKITILGELKSYIDENGFEQPIPNEWVGIYNVKWEREVKINKNIPNETRVRFIKRPIVEIEELDESFYAKTLVSTAQSSSTVRGYALTPSEGTDVRGYRGAIRYYLEIQSGSFKDGATTISVSGTGIQDADVLEYLNQSTVIVRVPYTGSDNTIQRFESGSYALNYQYFTNPTESPILGSFGRFAVSNLATFVGDVERLKVFRKSRASNLDYSVIQDIRVDSSEILTNVISGSIERVGFFTGSYLDGTNWNTYWNTASIDATLDSSKIYKAVKFRNNTLSSNLGNDARLFSGSEYTLEYYTLYDSSSNDVNDTLSVYLTSTLRSGSGIVNYYLTQSLEYLTGSNQFRNSVKRSVNFIPTTTDDWTLNFKSINSTPSSSWQVGSVSLKTSNELGYSPDSFNFIIPIDRQLEQETFDFKFEYFDINNNYVPIDVFAQQQFVSGNIKLIDKEIVVDADKNYFSFDSDLIAIPESQQVNISISKNRVLGDLLITSQAFDSGGVPIPPASYSAVLSPYPGAFGSYSENLYSASAVLTLSSFTGSRHANPPTATSVIVDRIVYTLTETSSSLPATKNFTIFRQSDGEKDKQVLARANKNQFTYKRTTLAPDPSNQRIVISVDRLNLPSSSVYPITHVKSGGNLLATLSGSANTSPVTYVLDAGTNAASTFVTGSGYNSTTYIFQQLDRRGVPYTGSVTIDPVVINSPLTVNLSNDNFTLRAKSSLYASQFLSANNDITESAQFTSQKAKVTVNVGGEAIVPAASSTTNRFWITTAVSGCLATTTTGSLAADGIDVGISAFTNNSYEQGLVTLNINYLDALGVTETATKTITFKKQRNSVPTIDLNVNPTSQTLSANSLGAVAGGNTTAGYTTLNVTATESGVSRFDRIKSVSQVPVSTITTAISTNTVTLNNMVSGSDSVQLTLDEVHYTFGEGSYGTGSLKSSVAKARKAAPVLKIEITNKAQSVTAKSTGAQIGAFSNPVVTVSETYNGTTTTKPLTALTATSADIATIVTTFGTGTITLNGRTLANGTNGTVVEVSATITDSEGTSRSLTDTISLSKIKNAAPTTLVTLTPEGQNVASASSGYGTPAAVQVVVKESSNYTEDKVSPFADSTFYISSITNGVTGSSGTFTPSTPTSDAGVTTTIVVSYVNSEGVAGSETRTHKVTPVKDGRQGPGLLYIGDYATKKAAEPGFVLNNSATKKDAVKNAGKFYAFRGADLTTINATSTPTNGGDATWEEFTSFSAVATGLLIAEESYVQNTINVGTNAAGNAANVTIWGGDASPYISVGQGVSKVYEGAGIFLGTAASTFKFSIVSGTKYLKWTGTDLLINAGNFSVDASGNISATGGSVSLGNSVVLNSSGLSGANFTLNNSGLNATAATINGNITCTTLTANLGGTIAGWSINATQFSKSNGTYTTKFLSTDSSIKMTLNSTGQDQVYIYPTDSIPEIVQASTDTTTFTGTGATLATYTAVGGGTGGMIDFNYVTDAGRGDTGILPGGGGNGFAYGTGTGIITLTNPTEEIWVETALTNANMDALVSSFSGLEGVSDTGTLSVSVNLEVKKFVLYSDAIANTNAAESWTRYLGGQFATLSGGSTTKTPYVNTNPASIRVNSSNNYFRISLRLSGYYNITNANANAPNPTITLFRPNVNIVVRFGAIAGGQTVVTPVGIQAYASSRNFMLAAIPAQASSYFFDVRGSARFQNGLIVTGAFSATTKAFKINHPIDENKWLYHSSIEGPAADLIYRGTARLENGSASIGIDSASRMTDGTFHALTKKPQLFLQNNQTFDRVKGYVESGSVFIVCEDAGSNALIDWTVIAERNDAEVLTSEQYGADGNYVPEKMKRAYMMELERVNMERYASSSIEEVK